MTKYIIQRILVSIPVFLGITLLVYGLYALSPGDPVVNIVGIEQFHADDGRTERASPRAVRV